MEGAAPATEMKLFLVALLTNLKFFSLQCSGIFQNDYGNMYYRPVLCQYLEAIKY